VQLISAENLAYWYLRLNGFLNIPNFVVHPDRGNNQETDVDFLGIRFPYRAENLEEPMQDDPCFSEIAEKSFLAIAEVKVGKCDLNGPWTNPARRNMKRVLRAAGLLPEQECGIASKELYKSGFYENQLYFISLLCLGGERNSEIEDKYPNVMQILWPSVLSFIFHRFEKYRNQKVSHPQWDDCGKALWNEFENNRRNHDDFLNAWDIT